MRRIWDAPPAAHLLGLALILLALVPLIGTNSSFISDEGAAIIQGRSLSSGQGWLVPHPLPDIDPEGRFYPLVNSERGSRGFAPLAKHPAYSLLVAGADRLGGVAGMVLLSVAGTVAAAALAGGLAARFDPVLRRPTIHVVGLASPLLFDGFVVIGHTLGAALAAAAVLCAVRAIEERRLGMALAVAPCIGGAVLLRSEAILLAGALAAVALVIALRARPWAPALLVAGAASVAAAGARFAETAWIARIIGDLPPMTYVPAHVSGDGFLQERVDSFTITWLLPDYKGSQPLSLLLLAVMTGLVLAAVAARSSPARQARVLVPAAVSGCAAVAALVVAPASVVPGLLVAFPLLAAGLAVLRRALFRDVGAALAGATSALFALGVIATQYPTGGTGEWGGRYFALAIPVIVPVVVLALYRQGLTLDRVTRRGALAALVLCSTALTTTAVFSLRSSHQYWDGFVGKVEQAQDIAGPGRPVVTTWSAAPRFSWAIFDRSPWLLAERDDVAEVRSALADRGTDRFVFVTVDVAADRELLTGLDVIWADGPLDGGRRILVVEESAPRTGVLRPSR
ncbi:MAG: hypothetical protein ACR2KK_05670 [Acidimicrobiales bacterium]